jgi:hypothetical protein
MDVSGVRGTRPAWRLAAVVGLLSLSTVPSASAQTLPYKFVKIADTVDNPSAVINGVYCVGINGSGMVVIKNSQNAVWRGNGGPLEEFQASNAAGICPSINDLGEIAYLSATNPGSPVLTSVLYRRLDAAPPATLASAATFPFLYSPTTYLPSLSDAGSALVTAKSGTAIYIVPDGIAVYDPAMHPALSQFTSPASMNEVGQAVFAGSDAIGVAIFRNGAVPFLRNGQAVAGGTVGISSLQRPLINDGGRIAFLGRVDPTPGAGEFGVYTSADGVNVSLAGRSPVDRFSLNNSGHVAYRRTFASPRTGVYLGRPGLVDQPVAPENGGIDGTTLLDAYVWEESLNDAGQVAFWALLANGRWGVYRADPQWLKGLSFAAKVPGCGPVNGKVTLNAPAPPGGLVVTLHSDNAAATVPPTVTVRAGKTSASFQIDPDPVSANVVGAITATVGPQSVERTLTVRRIGVKSLTLTPNPVTGGTPVLGTVRLDCGASPADILVTLSSRSPAIAQPAVPTLNFPVGTATLDFSITTSAVGVSSSATIRAAGGGVTKSKKLVVNP